MLCYIQILQKTGRLFLELELKHTFCMPEVQVQPPLPHGPLTSAEMTPSTKSSNQVET